MIILFARNNHWISRLVRWRTNSDWSHVAITYGDNVIEAVGGRGVRLTPRRAFNKRYTVIEERYLDGDAEVARDLIGKGFDEGGLWGLVFGRITWQDPDKWFCSELVAKASTYFNDEDAHRATPQILYMISREHE